MHGIKARTLLDILVGSDKPVAVKVGREVTVSHDDGTGIAAAQVVDKTKQRAFLRCGARVGGTSGGIETALITDTYGVGVMVATVGTGNSLCPTLMNTAVGLYIIVITDVFPAVVAYMVSAAPVEGVPAVAARGAAVDDDKCYSSHYVYFLL